ncbi:hypothetical protein RCO48_27985 [Peribacillus frigoritolerans]|nr:hypothetical protein [Peribacillus frigoritolerans]
MIRDNTTKILDEHFSYDEVKTILNKYVVEKRRSFRIRISVSCSFDVLESTVKLTILVPFSLTLQEKGIFLVGYSQNNSNKATNMMKKNGV